MASPSLSAIALLLLLLGCSLTSATVTLPPRGWNSWDAFNDRMGSFNETEFRQVAITQAQVLLPFGYDIITIDEFWYEQDASVPGSVDQWGRAMPNLAAYPSAAGGVGFKPLADWAHSLGLKFGIHIMHTVPKAAIDQKLPILNGQGVTADMIAVPSPCPWNNGWFGVNMSHPGGQAYIDSLYALYAQWGVDFIKNDCTFAVNYDFSNIQAVHNAMVKSGRNFTYSLSPGSNAQLAQAQAVHDMVNIYRITNDWHGPAQASSAFCGPWEEHMQQAAAFYTMIGASGVNGLSFPDMDMLADVLRNDSEHLMEMSFWAIVRSPLIIGMDIRNQSADQLWYYTNPEVLAVQAFSKNNRPVTNTTEQGQGGCTRIQTAVWAAEATNTTSPTVYVALLNPSNLPRNVTVTFSQLGLQSKTCIARDLWINNDVGTVSNALTVEVDNDSGTLYSLRACQ